MACLTNLHGFQLAPPRNVHFIETPNPDDPTAQPIVSARACTSQPCPNWLVNPIITNSEHYAIPTGNQHPANVAFLQATRTVTPQPMAAQITLTEQQLQTIIANSVAAALANVQAPTPAITLNTHEKPGKYKGDKGHNVERFISQCDAYYALSTVQSDKTRVISALGRLEEKAAE